MAVRRQAICGPPKEPYSFTKELNAVSGYGKGRNYSRYQGRRGSGARSFLKIVITALLLLLLLLLAAAWFFRDYLVYYEDGSVRLVLPWGSSAEPTESPSPPPSASVPLIIEEPEPSEEPEPPAEEGPFPLHAVQVSTTSLLAGTAAEEAVLAGGNAVVVSLKNDNGTLNYVSGVPLAVASGTSGSDLKANDALEALTAGDLYTIAEISCFRDDLMCRRQTQLAILTSGGYLWLDRYDVRWISPIQPDVTEYLTELCVELAEMGFDEILLTNCGYPADRDGQLHWIVGGNAYPEDGLLEPVIAAFLAQVKEALEPFDVKLSVKALATELAGDTADTGLTMSNVLAYCDRFWVDAAEAGAYANFAAAGGGVNPQELLVPIADTAGGEDVAWAVLD